MNLETTLRAIRRMLSLRCLFSAFVTLLAFIAFLPHAAAQSADTYRAEIVIVERKVSPDSVIEEMASRSPTPVKNLPQQLLVVDADGNQLSSVKLAPRSQMHLNSAAARLENSGRYRVLMTAAWYQSFPPDYSGKPMQVSLGNWLPEAAHREVEGQITIDRKRYLHVNVELNHWLPGTPEHTPAKIDEPVTPALQDDSVAAMATGGELVADTSAEQTYSETHAQLLTWIRETRRMRSEEIHFLDSPTIGVLIFFKKIGS